MAKTNKNKQQKILEKYLKKQEVLELKIDKSSEAIRSKIDLDELLKDPVKYITDLGNQYYLSHKKEVLEAIKIGEEGAKQILKEVNGKAIRSKDNKEGNISSEQTS